MTHTTSFASSASGGRPTDEGGSEAGGADSSAAHPPSPSPFVQAAVTPGEAGGVVTYLAPLATTVVRLKV